MKNLLPDFTVIAQTIIKFVIYTLVLGLIYLGIVHALSLEYRPESVVKTFISLLENPTDTITEEERKMLREITQTGLIENFVYENDVKTLRRVRQNNPVTSTPIEYTGDSRRVAKSELQFTNDFTNPDSKKATLHLERYGTWYNGYRWRIFKIEMPREDSVFDEAGQQAQDLKESIESGSQNIFNQIQNFLNPQNNNE